MPQVIYNGKVAENLAGILNELGTKKLFLVCGNSFDRQECAAAVRELPVELVRFSGITPNPKYEEVCEGLARFKETGCDTILGVGGGSYLDVAKCIKLFCRMPESENYISLPREDTGIPLIAIPTTSGTGSESTRHAVIYYRGVKQSISHESILPDYVILEPSVLKSLPELQRKAPMLDALCHAVESYWNVKSTDESKRAAAQAIRLLLSAKDVYLANTEDGNAAMLQASNLAGQAINITATTAGHAMSYKISSMFGIPHGQAAAFCLTAVWPYLALHTDACIDPRGEAYLKKTLDELALLFRESNATIAEPLLAAEDFQKLYDSMNFEKRPKTADKSDIEILTASVNPERLGNFPIQMTPEVLENLYMELVYRPEEA